LTPTKKIHQKPNEANQEEKKKTRVEKKEMEKKSEEYSGTVKQTKVNSPWRIQNYFASFFRFCCSFK